MRIALFITCIGDTFFPEAGRATVEVLERLGHEVVLPPGQTCCGQLHANSGHAAEAVKQRLTELGAVPAPNTPPQFAQLIETDRQRYAKIIRERGITVD